MRRKIKSKISILLVLLVALSTLFSYGFDQLAIGQEDGLRIENIKHSNLQIEINLKNSLNNQLQDIYDGNNKIIEKSLKLRNVWIKSYLAINLKKNKKLNFNKFFIDLKLSEKNIVKYSLIENFITGMRDNYYFCEKISNFYQRSDIFMIKKKYHQKCAGEYKTIINAYSDQLNNKDIIYSNFLENKAYEKEKFDQITKTLNEEHWLDINFLTLMLYKELGKKNTSLIDDFKILDTQIGELLKEDSLTLQNIEKLSSNKNYFILLSIITQILSLLFLLVLFRNLLLNNLFK